MTDACELLSQTPIAGFAGDAVWLQLLASLPLTVKLFEFGDTKPGEGPASVIAPPMFKANGGLMPASICAMDLDALRVWAKEVIR